MEQLQSGLGYIALLALCWLTGGRSAIPHRLILSGIALQAVIALILLKVPQSQSLFLIFNKIMLALEEATQAGTSLVFGFLGGSSPPFEVTQPEHSFILAFRALPLVLVVSALSALLFHWRILPAVVRGFSGVLRKTMGISGPLGVGATANIFLGMVESPLLIRPYLLRLHRGELFALMVCGMATVAGTVLVLYASILNTVIPNALGHVLTASLISAPAALTLSALYKPWPSDQTRIPPLPPESANAMDAVTQGTTRGLSLVLNIIAMLIVLVALVALVNIALAGIASMFGSSLSLQQVFGWLFAPLAWLTGIPWNEAISAGQFLGTKVILNELIAYLDLAASGNTLSERSRLLLSYSLCGFANLGSLGIMIAGLGTMVPERRAEIIAMGLPSIWVGLLSTLLTAALVGTIS
jgi:Nucleoside permease